MRVSVTEGLREGVAFAPFHWGARHARPGAGQANAATNPVVDPTSKQPELKAAAVRVEPVADAAVAARRRRSHPRRLLVVGSGMAALETVEEVLKRTEPGAWRVTMLGEEPGAPYNRMQLSKLLAEEIGAEALELRPPAWFAKHGVELRGGCPATRIDPERRRVLAGDGGEDGYDALVIATGSRPFVPPIPGASEPGVLTFRTLADVAAIDERRPRRPPRRRDRRRAARAGGGRGAASPRSRGHRRRGGSPPDAAAARPGGGGDAGDGAGGTRHRERLRRRGRALRRRRGRAGRRPRARGGADRRRRRGPARDLARRRGGDRGRAAASSSTTRCATSAPAVWAVGECAEHRGIVYGLWAPLAEQARVAGASVSGDPAAFHRRAGGHEPQGGGHRPLRRWRATAAATSCVWIDGRRGVYRKLILDGERLVAAILLGDVAGARELSALLRSGEAVPERLLAPPGAAAESPAAEPGDLVCSCNAVTRGEIEAAIRARGLRSALAVGRETRAGTGCGSCVADVEAILHEQDSSTRNRDVTDAKRLRSRMPA